MGQGLEACWKLEETKRGKTHHFKIAIWMYLEIDQHTVSDKSNNPLDCQGPPFSVFLFPSNGVSFGSSGLIVQNLPKASVTNPHRFQGENFFKELEAQPMVIDPSTKELVVFWYFKSLEPCRDWNHQKGKRCFVV